VGIVHVTIATLFLSALALLVLVERREVRAHALTLLRCLFPAWRFFEALDPGPLLSYRVAARDGALGPWLAALPEPGPRHLLLNAAGNLRLAYQSLVEQFAAELEAEPAEPAELVSFRLIDALVQERIRSGSDAASVARYQFRLSERSPGEPELFVSAERVGSCSP
jgi:hypothetical protein